MQGEYEEEAAKAMEANGKELTVADSDAIWHSITDPPTRGRRYVFGNQEVRLFLDVNYYTHDDL